MKSIIDNYQLPCIKRLHIVGSHKYLTANAEYSLLELLGDKFLEDAVQRISIPYWRLKHLKNLFAHKKDRVNYDCTEELNEQQQKVLSAAIKYLDLPLDEFPELPLVLINNGVRLIDDIDPYGYYVPIYNIIVLESNEIHKDFKREKYELALNIVLCHELGHWISHELKLKNNKTGSAERWEDRNFRHAETEVKEFWAQIISYAIMNEEERELQLELSNNQNEPYQLYIDYRTKNILDIFDLLKDRESDDWLSLKTKLDALS